MILLWILSLLFLTNTHQIHASTIPPTFPPCDPISENFSRNIPRDVASPQFCAKWNPDYIFNGRQCCGKTPIPRRKRRGGGRCSPQRTAAGYCAEMTQEQKDYIAAANAGKLGDMLDLLIKELGKKKEQAHCTVNNGFLTEGRPVIPDAKNRIMIKSAERCLYFGTDPLVGMLEWLGRELNKKYQDPAFSGVKLVLGNISGPRGGCLFGRNGRRGHASHTSGQDADIGFHSASPGKESPGQFVKKFEVGPNFWFLKQIFSNPFACIKVIFLDRSHIRALDRKFGKDREWQSIRKFVRHSPGHRNHFHVRVGSGPGVPGCVPGAPPEPEEADDSEVSDEFEMSIFDELRE